MGKVCLKWALLSSALALANGCDSAPSNRDPRNRGQDPQSHASDAATEAVVENTVGLATGTSTAGPVRQEQGEATEDRSLSGGTGTGAGVNTGSTAGSVPSPVANPTQVSTFLSPTQAPQLPASDTSKSYVAVFYYFAANGRLDAVPTTNPDEMRALRDAGWSALQLFTLFAAPGDGRVAVYRCRDVSDHFISPDGLCEGKVAEGRLGFTTTIASGTMHVHLLRTYITHPAGNFHKIDLVIPERTTPDLLALLPCNGNRYVNATCEMNFGFAGLDPWSPELIDATGSPFANITPASP